MPYEIEVEGLNELRAKFEQSPVIVGEELAHATKMAGAGIIKEEVIQAPHDTGKLQQSIKMDYEPIQVAIYPDIDYAKYIVKGTRPHTPPLQALEGWSRRHGIDPRIVQMKIRQKGTKANDFVKRTRDAVKGMVNDLFQTARKNIIERL